MVQKEVKVDSVTLENNKTLKEELNGILSRYLFEYNTSYVRESIKNEVERFLKYKFENREVPFSVQTKYSWKDKIPTNIVIEYNEDDSSLGVCPNDDETLELFKDLELL